MLQTLRNNTRTILWIVVASFVAFIILVWGADLQVGRAAKGTVGSVNGREIPYTLYQRQMTADLQNLRAQGQRNPTFEEERQTVEQTWRSIVDQILISQEAKKNPLPISDEEVVFWVKSNPPPQLQQNPAFLDSMTGQFNQARYEEALRSSPEQFLWYEELMRAQLPLDKLQRNVLASAKVSEGEVDAYVRDRYEQLRMSYLWVDPRKFPDPGPPVTEAEARAYFDSHPEEFAGKERIQLVVARIPKAASPEDETAARARCRPTPRRSRAAKPPSRASPRAFPRTPSPPPAAIGAAPCGARRSSRRSPRRCSRRLSQQVSEPIRIDNRLLLMQVTADTLIDGEPARRFSAIERRIQPGADRLTELRESARGIAAAAGRQGLAAAAKAAGAEADTTAFVERQSFTPLLMGARDALEQAFELQPGRVGNLHRSRERVHPLSGAGQAPGGTDRLRRSANPGGARCGADPPARARAREGEGDARRGRGPRLALRRRRRRDAHRPRLRAFHPQGRRFPRWEGIPSSWRPPSRSPWGRRALSSRPRRGTSSSAPTRSFHRPRPMSSATRPPRARCS